MTPDPAGIQDSRTPGRAAPRWGGGDAPRGTVGWYWDASGGFIPGTPDTWNPQVAFLVFPRITSSPGIDRRATSRFAARSHHISTLPVADQVRELQTALSVNKSELARILRVSRPTVYDWLDDGRLNADNWAILDRRVAKSAWEHAPERVRRVTQDSAARCPRVGVRGCSGCLKSQWREAM